MRLAGKLTGMFLAIYTTATIITAITVTELTFRNQKAERAEEALQWIETQKQAVNTVAGRDRSSFFRHDDDISAIARMLSNRETKVSIFTDQKALVYSDIFYQWYVPGEEFGSRRDRFGSDGSGQGIGDDRSRYVSVTDGLYLVVTGRLVVSNPVFPDVQGRTLLYTQVADAGDIREARSDHYVLFLTFALIGIPIAFVISPVVSRIVTRRIHRLNESAREIAAGEYRMRVPVTGRDEVAQLSRQFNAMAEEIERSFETLNTENESKERFIENLTHELRTPLTSVIGYADLLLSVPYDPTRFTECVLQIKAEGKRMLDLSNTLMAIILNGKRSIDRRGYSSFRLISDAIAVVRPHAADRDIQLSIDGQDTEVMVDPDLAKIVLINIAENAIHASGPGDTVTIGSNRDNDGPSITVRDNGNGIPKEEQERIFEPFYRVDASRSRRTGGAGLGLALVKEILSLHDAEIRIESTVGAGTTVILTF